MWLPGRRVFQPWFLSRSFLGLLEEQQWGPCGWNSVWRRVKWESVRMWSQNNRGLDHAGSVGHGKAFGSYWVKWGAPGGYWEEEGDNLTYILRSLWLLLKIKTLRECRSMETSQEAFVIFQVRDDGDLDQILMASQEEVIRSFRKDIFTGYRNLGWRVVCFVSVHLLKIVSWPTWSLTRSLWFLSLFICKYCAFFPLAAFKTFPSNLILRNLVLMCFGMVFFVFILFGSYWASWVCVFINFTNFGKFLTLSFSNILFVTPIISLWAPITLMLDHLILSHR